MDTEKPRVNKEELARLNRWAQGVVGALDEVGRKLHSDLETLAASIEKAISEGHRGHR